MPLSDEERLRMLEASRLNASMRAKSPAVAGLLAFFFPTLGMLYVRRWFAAVIFLILDVVDTILAFVGIGFLFLLFWRIVAVIMATSGVNKITMRNLDKEIQTYSKKSNYAVNSADEVASMPSIAPLTPQHISNDTAAVSSGPTASPLFCGVCGAKLSEGINFCEDCGTKVMA